MTLAIPNEPGGQLASTASPVSRREVEVRWRLSRHARRLLTLALAAMLLAVLNRRPELAGLAAPALLLLGVGGAGAGWAARQRPPRAVLVAVRPSDRRLFEGEPAWIDLAVELPGEPGGGYDARWAFHPGRGIEPASATAVTAAVARFEFTAPRWGRRQAGMAELVLHDRWHLTEGQVSVTLPALDCYPRPGVQQETVVLSRLPNRLGEHPARVPGEGAEFAGVREYVPGDRQRQINWPASTRRGRLMVNTFAAERSQDVVLLVDATTDVGQPGSSALDMGLRGAAAAARAYLSRRDRVGVITYQWGGARWLAPSLGRRQVYKIIDTMLHADATWDRGASFRRLPRAALPPGSLVVAFSPLLDQRFVEALRDMRERGFSLIVVDVLNVTPPRRWSDAWSATDRIARRIWAMDQHAIRFALRELGVPVVHWDGVAPLDLPLAPYTRRALLSHGGATPRAPRGMPDEKPGISGMQS
jgi:uncharacterized protein (DUF58 family)